MFSDDDVAKVLLHYPSTTKTISDAVVVLAAANDHVDQQKRANDIYSESVFVCPSYVRFPSLFASRLCRSVAFPLVRLQYL